MKSSGAKQDATTARLESETVWSHFIIREQLKRLLARLDRWSLIVTVCFPDDKSTEFRTIGNEPQRFSR